MRGTGELAAVFPRGEGVKRNATGVNSDTINKTRQQKSNRLVLTVAKTMVAVLMVIRMVPVQAPHAALVGGAVPGVEPARLHGPVAPLRLRARRLLIRILNRRKENRHRPVENFTNNMQHN